MQRALRASIKALDGLLSLSDNEGVQPPDPLLDTLTELDGVVLVIDPERGFWVRFVVTSVPVTAQKPHGLDYSLTLHDKNGERVLGFDNAHRVAKQKSDNAQDHRHRSRTVQPYEYEDAGKLLQDFWTEVDRFLNER